MKRNCCTLAFAGLSTTITNPTSSRSPQTLEVKWISWSYLIYRHKSPFLSTHHDVERITTMPYFPDVSKREKNVFLHFIKDICVCVHVCNRTTSKTKRLQTPTKRLYVQYVLTCKCKLNVFHSLTDNCIHTQTKLPAGSIHPSQRLWCEKKDFLVTLEWV